MSFACFVFVGWLSCGGLIDVFASWHDVVITFFPLQSEAFAATGCLPFPPAAVDQWGQPVLHLALSESITMAVQRRSYFDEKWQERDSRKAMEVATLVFTPVGFTTFHGLDLLKPHYEGGAWRLHEPIYKARHAPALRLITHLF